MVAIESHVINGIPCIIGNASERMGDDETYFRVVFQSSGEREMMHPLPVRDLCLYEVAVGDFITMMERVDGTLYVNAYYVQQITDRYVVAIPAVL